MSRDGIEPATFRFVTQHLNLCATAVPISSICARLLVLWTRFHTKRGFLYSQLSKHCSLEINHGQLTAIISCEGVWPGVYWQCGRQRRSFSVDTLRRGADKSLAQLISRCRKESIVSFEQGSVRVLNTSAFLVTEAEKMNDRRRARFQQHGDASCHQVFFSFKARRRN